MKEDLRTNTRNKKLLNLDLISQRNHRMNIGDFSENVKSKKPKIRTKLTLIKIIK